MKVHETRLIAAMLVHNVTNILTLNHRDFAPYSSASARCHRIGLTIFFQRGGIRLRRHRPALRVTSPALLIP